MKLVSWLVLASFATQVLFPERAAALDVQQRQALQEAFSLYTASKTYGEFIDRIRDSVSIEDHRFLQSRFDGKLSLPKGQLKGDTVVLEPHRIRVLDVDTRELELNGKKISYDLDQSLSANAARIEKELGVETSLFDLVIPSANAEGAVLTIFVVLLMVAMAAAAAKSLWKFFSKSAIESCEEKKAELRKSGGEVTEAEKNAIDMRLGGVILNILTTCERAGENTDQCRELRKLESCLKQASGMLRVKKQSYGGTLGREHPAAGGSAPLKPQTPSSERAL